MRSMVNYKGRRIWIYPEESVCPCCASHNTNLISVGEITNDIADDGVDNYSKTLSFSCNVCHGKWNSEREYYPQVYIHTTEKGKRFIGDDNYFIVSNKELHIRVDIKHPEYFFQLYDCAIAKIPNSAFNKKWYRSPKRANPWKSEQIEKITYSIPINYPELKEGFHGTLPEWEHK